MKNRLIITLATVASLVVCAPALSSSAQKGHNGEDREMAEREETRQTYEVPPGVRVSVTSINGSLDVETTSGHTAELHVIRSARSRAELEYRKIIVESTSSSFRVYSEEPPEEIRNNVRVSHRVVLKIPVPGELVVRNVNGYAKIGDVAGPVTLNNINGDLDMGQATSFAEFANINGNTKLTILRLGERGIRMRNVNGNINLRFVDSLNADIDVRSLNGEVSPQMANVTVQKVGRNDFRAQIGAGGTPISMSHINGRITISGASDGTR